MKEARKFALAVKPIPEGYHSITPYLTVRGDRAIDFYRRAFGAEVVRHPGSSSTSRTWTRTCAYGILFRSRDRDAVVRSDRRHGGNAP